MPMRGDFGRLLRHDYHSNSSAIAASLVHFSYLFLPGLSRYKSKDGSEIWGDLQRNATRVGRPALAVL
jgi:hypothetical protein